MTMEVAMEMAMGMAKKWTKQTYKSIINHIISDDLELLKNNLQKASECMDAQVQNEDVVILLGNSKAGKSSLINYIIGNKLIGKKNFKTRPVAIQKFDNSKGPEIGRNAIPTTIIPTRWENKEKLPGLALWDSPGFNDIRGVVQDITNANYVYKLFKNVKSVKVVLVVDINDINSDSVQPFLMLLTAVEAILQEKMVENFSSIVVIFTKVPKEMIDGVEASISAVRDLLKDQFCSTSEIEISQNSRKFLHYLIDNGNIGLFMKVKTGPIDDSIDVGIFDAILKADSIPGDILRLVASPSISCESENFLSNIRKELFSLKTFSELEQVIKEVYENIVFNYSQNKKDEISLNQLESILKELEEHLLQVKSTFKRETSLEEKLEMLKNLDSKIANKIIDENLIEKSKWLEFIDDLLNLNESQIYSFTLYRTGHHVLFNVTELIFKIQSKIHEAYKKEMHSISKEMQEKYEEKIIKFNAEAAKKMIQEKQEYNERLYIMLREMDELRECNQKLENDIKNQKSRCLIL